MIIQLTSIVYTTKEKVNKEIQMNQKCGWQLEGKPDILEDGTMMLTFKKMGDPEKDCHTFGKV